MAWKHRILKLVLACSGLALSACETSDPCILRQAACLDVTLIGKKDVSYSGLTVTVTGMGVSLMERRDRLEQTAPAGVQGLVSFRLPDEFNQREDIKPDKVIGELDSDEKKIEKLKELRAGDARAIRIVVEATEVAGAEMSKVRWDSQQEEQLRIEAAEAGATDLWLRLLYFRVGKNQYQAAYVPLCSERDVMTKLPICTPPQGP